MANSAIQSAQFGVATEAQRGVVNGTDTRNLVFGGAALGFRNKIINGDMRIAQRGTSTTNATSSYAYSLDRWRFYGQSTTGSATVSQQAFTAGQTDVPNEPEYFLRWDQTVTPGGVVALTQPIEGVRTFAGQNATLSFWAKANSARSITVRLTQNFGTGGSTAVSVTSSSQALTTVWQKFTITFAVPSISGKTIGANNYLDVLFLDSNLGTFTIDIAQVQLEAGSVATPFENRPIGAELALCQRYYERGNGSLRISVAGGFVYGNASWISSTINYKVTKRIAPTVLNTTTSFLTNCSPGAQSTNILTGGAFVPTTESWAPSIGGSATPPSSGTYVYWDFDWNASAEL